MGIWIGSAGLGYVIAGTSFSIGHSKSSLASWRLIFLVWGSITIAWGNVLAIFLPGSPMTARLLAENERTLAVNRLKIYTTGLENKTLKYISS
ncbi:major facilitator superfamily transporter allantoate [Grosmannia clavigera kw1407]|uniref:Major facilitator superfamily transporter allantoate n=1 Tax=Grosmannia clavigera (strain kw1407 / UAMH 11150) TaxID=655863 RepID=F0XL74_GROCL|nr:major facilitator superfamily transporter allantoate [Grosmannia clavigera kw1407]EFX01657.1 major facilitator superfamily transporter allantoate [Grosmannia clavigera kw1407]